MKGKSLLIMTALVAFAVIFAAGCIDGGNGGPTEEKTELSFGYQPSTHQIAYMVAKDKGWWEEDLAPFGITTITDHKFPTGAPEMQAMLAGEIDVAYVGAAPVISALDQGLDAKIIAAVQVQGSDLVVRPEVTYTGPEDLKGLTIATFPPGTIQDTLLRDWLQQNGIDPDTDVDIRGMGPGDATVAIAESAVDAVFLPHPAPATIAAEGNGYTAVTSGEMMQDHACCVLVASGDLIRNHPDIVEQIVKTHIRATEYSIENQEEAAQIYHDMNKVELDVIEASFASWDGRWVTDPALIVVSVVDYTEVQAELGYIKNPMTADEIFDLSFYEKAVAA
ncbi:sulfonate ABC transporter substrate-binding protein [Methanomicrobiaceae archaeon CYW5]|uniref:ABC transporter substrate-binding protein n=1 Tax=Methanovulcanius yangii TaxID=1789227 RepID=UPI0029CA02FF|nr:ABC transporter substrate-binding protein [Methanovulcanius yangii]MBT8507969.1 sulfonate ABC transporter substrate-binding protein [Methanovulcanius yangii]